MGRARGRFSVALAAISRDTPAFRPAYRPLPAALFRQLWAGLTRSTPAFTGARPLSGPAAATTEERRERASDELDELVSIVNDAAPSPGHLAGRAETATMRMEWVAVPDDVGTFTLTLALSAADGRSAHTMSAALALYHEGEFFLAGLTASGVVTFAQVPAGRWRLRRLGRRRSGLIEQPGIALPVPPPAPQLAAAAPAGGTAIVRAVLPGGEDRLILHREREGGYVLEVLRRSAGDAPVIVRVRYGTADGEEVTLLVPVQREALVRLDRYSPAAPWRVFPPLPPDQILTWDAETVGVSVRAAVNNSTKRAWREISADRDIQELVSRELEEP
jgi:hypothetical protein